MKITEKADHIKIDGHKGFWYVIDYSYHRGQEVFLLEHETYGDEAAGLIVDEKGKIILNEVYNGWFDLDESNRW